MNKALREKLKEGLTKKLDGDITAIQTRIENRKVQFDYENARDEEKLNTLKLQQEGVKDIKP